MTMPTQETSPTRSRLSPIQRRRLMFGFRAAGVPAQAASSAGTDGRASESVPAPAAPVGGSYWSNRGRAMTSCRDPDGAVFIATCVMGTIFALLMILGLVP